MFVCFLPNSNLLARRSFYWSEPQTFPMLAFRWWFIGEFWGLVCFLYVMLLLSFCPLPNFSVSSRLPSGDEGDNFYVIDQGEVDVSGRKELSHSRKKQQLMFCHYTFDRLNQIVGGWVGQPARKVRSRIVGNC